MKNCSPTLLLLAASFLVCLVTGLMFLIIFWCQSGWLVKLSIICLGSADTSSGAPCWLGLTPAPTSILILSLMLCLWSSCWPDVSLPGPTMGSSCIAIGDLVTLNSAAMLPRNSRCFDQPKLRAASCLTTLQELSLAKVQAGGSLPGRKVLPQVPIVAINGSSYYASVNLSNLLPPSLPLSPERGQGVTMLFPVPHPFSPYPGSNKGWAFLSPPSAVASPSQNRPSHHRKKVIIESRCWLRPGVGVLKEIKRFG